MEKHIKIPVIQYLAIIYNMLEAFFVILFGTLTNSYALIGFGLDSIGESFTGMIMIRRMNRYDEETVKLKEVTVKPKPNILLAIIFFGFGSFVFYHSVNNLMLGQAPAVSPAGMIIALISFIITPLLAFLSYKEKNSFSKAFISGLKAVWAYLFLSFSLLVVLSLNYFYGIWQGDPLIGLITVIYLFRKSLEALLGWGTFQEDKIQ